MRIKTLKSEHPATKVYASDQENSSLVDSKESDCHRSPQVTARNSHGKSGSPLKPEEQAAAKKRGRRGYADLGQSDIWQKMELETKRVSPKKSEPRDQNAGAENESPRQALLLPTITSAESARQFKNAMKDINRRIQEIETELEASAAEKSRKRLARDHRRFGTIGNEPEKGLSDRKKRLLDSALMK